MFKCKYCGSERKNDNSLVQHQIRCKQNPDAISPPDRKGKNNPMYGKKGSNAYIKAKESGTEPPSLSIEARESISAKNKARVVTQETKDKISKSRKRYLEENPDKVPYLINHYSKGMSYPESYFKDILDRHSIVYKQEYRIGLYSLDFAIMSQKIDIEIDGEQHYVDKRIVESDINRTKFLESKGWNVIRVRWSEYCKLSFDDRKKFIENLIKEIN